MAGAKSHFVKGAACVCVGELADSVLSTNSSRRLLLTTPRSASLDVKADVSECRSEHGVNVGGKLRAC
jgi:hypothetical protein